MKMPSNVRSTICRLFPAFLFFPFQVVFLGRGGFYFKHPFSRCYGAVRIGYLAEIGPFCNLNASNEGILLGAYSQINSGCTLVGSVFVGDRVLVAPGCVLASGGHSFGLGVQPRFSGAKYKGPLVIGDDVWIGANVTVVGPVQIGEGSVIGAGLVIDFDVPARSLVRRGSAGMVVEDIR